MKQITGAGVLIAIMVALPSLSLAADAGLIIFRGVVATSICQGNGNEKMSG
jgi:hypothetical protein